MKGSLEPCQAYGRFLSNKDHVMSKWPMIILTSSPSGSSRAKAGCYWLSWVRIPIPKSCSFIHPPKAVSFQHFRMHFPNILGAICMGHGLLPWPAPRQRSISISLARGFCFFRYPETGVGKGKYLDGNAENDKPSAWKILISVIPKSSTGLWIEKLKNLHYPIHQRGLAEIIFCFSVGSKILSKFFVPVRLPFKVAILGFQHSVDQGQFHWIFKYSDVFKDLRSDRRRK